MSDENRMGNGGVGKPTEEAEVRCSKRFSQNIRMVEPGTSGPFGSPRWDPGSSHCPAEVLEKMLKSVPQGSRPHPLV